MIEAPLLFLVFLALRLLVSAAPLRPNILHFAVVIIRADRLLAHWLK